MRADVSAAVSRAIGGRSELELVNPAVACLSSLCFSYLHCSLHSRYDNFYFGNILIVIIVDNVDFSSCFPKICLFKSFSLAFHSDLN